MDDLDDSINPQAGGQPWQWPETRWRQMVERTRAGRSLLPPAWPNGARCAVALSFTAVHETITLRDNDRSQARLSQGHYGARRGIPRLRALLQREAIPATFFHPCVAAILHPDEIAGLIADGHELAVHSWIAEHNDTLPYEAERDLFLRSADLLSRATGAYPLGVRTASGDFSPMTLEIIREMGLLYDSSMMADDDPYELLQDGMATGVVEIPCDWIRNDDTYFSMHGVSSSRPFASPAQVEEIFRTEFDGAWNEHGLFQLTLHPHVIGHRARMPVLERLVRHMKAKGLCWFATHAQVAHWCSMQPQE